MKKSICTAVALAFLLISCQPATEQIRPTIQPTQVSAAVQTPEATLTDTPSITPTSLPTATLTITPTVTLTLTATLAPTATSTEAPTITPTLSAEVYNTNPEKLLPTAEDMPPEGRYFMAGVTWWDKSSNDQEIQKRGDERGRDYVTSTGRITGWWMTYVRVPGTLNMPEQITVRISMYKTSAGAQLALQKYNPVEYDGKYEWKYQNIDKGLGNAFLAYYYKQETSGGVKIDYNFSFTERNYQVIVELWGLETEVTPDVAQWVGEKMLEKILKLPLVGPNDITQAP